jgi:hypothetical protein
MRAEPLEVELEGWGENAVRVTHVNLQHKKRGRIKMSMST